MSDSEHFPRATAAGASRERSLPQGSERLLDAIERVSQALDLETEALKNRDSVDVEELNNRKSQGLLELSRIGRRLDGAELDPRAVEMLSELRRKLEENRSVLKLHLEAVQEISQILTDAIRDEESDGTYSIRYGEF